MLVVGLANHLTAPETQNIDLDINCQLSAKDDESAEAVIEGTISFVNGFKFRLVEKARSESSFLSGLSFWKRASGRSVNSGPCLKTLSRLSSTVSTE